MSQNVANSLARDKGNEPMQEFPAPVLAIQRITSENATASSVISLSDRTVQLEVTATTTAAALRWVASSDTQGSVIAIAGATANYDHIIPANTMRRFVVPQERAGIPSISGANVMNGLYSRVAYKSLGIGSVMTSEY